MAQAVADALAANGVLVVESATGTGKTYAYLTPIILSGRRTLISTGTRHLQEQIFKHDIPQVSRALGRSVNAVLLKGRANYLCRHRFNLPRQQEELQGEDANAQADSAAREWRLLERWVNRTDSGDIAEVGEISERSPLWRQVTSTADNCLGGQCPDLKKCFVVKARQRAMQAEIVVVNHHLFFSDITLKEEGFGELLPEADAVVFDEAHSIADIASDFFGFTFTSGQLAEFSRDAQAAEKRERSGVSLTAPANKLEKALRKMHQALKPFADKSLARQAVQSAKFADACENLQNALAVFERALDKGAVAGEGLQRCHQRCQSLQAQLDSWHNGERDLIYWAQISARGFRLHGTPLSIGNRFGKMMEQEARAWIFTSATLAVGDDFSAFCNPLGLHHAETKRFPSPYDFRRNALLYLPPQMPQPSSPEYGTALTEVIANVLRASRGRAFCLFTSYAMMHLVHKELHEHAKEGGWQMLLQGHAPKNQLLNLFKKTERAVLLGTASFWEGVDVKGEHLACVIIDKLPFATPSDPVLRSRLTAHEQEGGNAFMDIQVPQAVIALKQGAGRLIRSETDRGVLVLCDPRIVEKNYGALFRASLPEMPETQRLGDVVDFFKRMQSARE